MKDNYELPLNDKIKFSFPAAIIISSACPKLIDEMICAANENEYKRTIYGDEIYNEAVRLMQSTIDYDLETCLQICQERRAKKRMKELKESSMVFGDIKND